MLRKNERTRLALRLPGPCRLVNWFEPYPLGANLVDAARRGPEANPAGQHEQQHSANVNILTI